jgi:uncharacterized protein
MDLTLHRPGEHNFVHSVTEQGFRIVDREYSGAVLVPADSPVAAWPVSDVAGLIAADIEPILELQPEIVLIGTGSRQKFPDPGLMMEFYRNGIGVEAMNTLAACRTFNVLMSESRNAVAALLPVSA